VIDGGIIRGLDGRIDGGIDSRIEGRIDGGRGT
jgi:hypothetical protein